MFEYVCVTCQADSKISMEKQSIKVYKTLWNKKKVEGIGLFYCTRDQDIKNAKVSY